MGGFITAAIFPTLGKEKILCVASFIHVPYKGGFLRPKTSALGALVCREQKRKRVFAPKKCLPDSPEFMKVLVADDNDDKNTPKIRSR